MNNRILTVLMAAGMAHTLWAQDAVLVKVLSNPDPAFNRHFGTSVAALGNDRVIVGEVNSRAHLLSTNGTPLKTFLSPSGTADWFGSSVAPVGLDKVLIGASAAIDNRVNKPVGVAYLFNTNGTLMVTFNDPVPTGGERFGSAVAALRGDRVLIGAPLDGSGAPFAGTAYLFNINGTLLTTVTNPIPSAGDGFGGAVAVMEDDNLLIGASGANNGDGPVGEAYLFSTNGLLLATFSNPIPHNSDSFGHSVAALGGNRVVVGAYQDSEGGQLTGETSLGVVHLFSTSGALLTTITNPSPASLDWFGFSVAGLGSNRLLIGALNSSPESTVGGTVFLYDADGTLLTTITNPTPSSGDYFGNSLATLGSDQVIIGAPRDDAGALDSGVAYLFGLPPPPPALVIAPVVLGETAISWTPATPGFVLQETETLSPANWTDSPSGAENPTSVPTAPPAKYFRLVKP